MRQVARVTADDTDPFEPAPQTAPSSPTHGSPDGSPASTSLPDLTFPHIDPLDVAAAAPLPVVTPSVKSLLSALLNKGPDDLKALDDDAMSLLRDVANMLFRFLRKTDPSAAGVSPSPCPGSVPAHSAPTVPAAGQSADPLTKPQSPPPRPPRSPTRPPPHAPRPPPAHNAASAPKQSYTKAVTSSPAAPAVAPVPPKATAPLSKTAAMCKSCLKQGTKATKVILQFPDSSKQPTVNQLWGTLAAFKPTDIALSLWGDFILTFSHVLDSDNHTTLIKKLKKVYSVDTQVLN